MKSQILYMYSVFFTCWKLGPRWIIYSCHILTLIFPPKSLFSITLILICITLSLVTLLGNHFSFHFIALWHCKRNVIALYPFLIRWGCLRVLRLRVDSSLSTWVPPFDLTLSQFTRQELCSISGYVLTVYLFGSLLGSTWTTMKVWRKLDLIQSGMNFVCVASMNTMHTMSFPMCRFLLSCK